jgi:hypothetical protein
LRYGVATALTFTTSYLAENTDEIVWVQAPYSASQRYLGVYDSFGLLRERSVLRTASTLTTLTVR